MLTKNPGKNLIQKKTVTSYEVKSFIDIKLKTNSINKLSDSSSTGLDATTVYSTVLTLGGSPTTLSVSGGGISTIAGLASALNTALGSDGEATFLGSITGSAEQVIRIQTAAADTTIAVDTVGNLITSLVGNSQVGIEASYSAPVTNGGYNFQLTNAASTDNPVDAMYLVQAETAAGADIAVAKTYDNTTGELTVKKSSGQFTATDKIVVVSAPY